LPLAGIAFDAFGTLFDLNGLRPGLDRALGEHGEEVFAGFRARLVPWSWHATAAGRYRPFLELAALALTAAGREAGVELSEQEAEALAGGLAELPAFPGVADGLEELAAEGHRLAVLSNGTEEGIRSLVASNGLERRFEHLLAADSVGRYKPAPEVYALAPGAFDCAKAEVLMVSGNDWDVAGAKQYGLRGAWLDRDRPLAPALGVGPDVVATDVTTLPRALREWEGR
jgi:2-haloacid dehalogenase